MKNILLFTFVLATTAIFGQRKYFADRFFDEFAYTKSAELYERLYERGEKTSYVVSRIGDSYYNNSEYQESEKWYGELLNNYEGEEISPEYYFKYAQSLKSNGKVEESDQWMLKFKEVATDDSRPQALAGNRDYFSEFTARETVYINVHNISENTKYSDFGGFIHDNKLIFASTKPYNETKQRIYKWNNQPFLNMYEAGQKDVNEERVLDVSKAEKLHELNSTYHESNLIYTKDGNTVYFTRDNYNGKRLRKDSKNTVNLKIYRSEKIDGKWSDAVELPFNSDEYSVGHPALSPDEQTLYFVSDMPGGIGSTDVYKVAVNGNKTYGSPVNLGNTINTEGKEMFPYVGSDNTLYFSSNGHLGLGALDVFESKMSGGSFGKPVNLAQPINSPKDDFAFILNEDSTRGYFSSNRDGGRGDDDIYSFVLSVCKESIAGVVTDKNSKEPIGDATVKLVDASGKILAERVTLANGKYSFGDLPCEEDYNVVATKQDYRQDQAKARTLDIDQEIIPANLQLEGLIKPAAIVAEGQPLPQIVIRPIYFDFDKYNIREDARYELEHIVDVMRNNPGMVIKIESHTDSRAPRAYNVTLSDNRAKSTRDYLISRGIGRERIESAIGYGEERLLNRCNDANSKSCSEEEHQLNRRSYFYIVSGANNVRVVEQAGE